MNFGVSPLMETSEDESSLEFWRPLETSEFCSCFFRIQVMLAKQCHKLLTWIDGSYHPTKMVSAGIVIRCLPHRQPQTEPRPSSTNGEKKTTES